jgi:PEGA domain-containing protein
MAPADDRPGPVSPARPPTSAFGSTSLLVAAIAMVSAAGSFGAVRAWYPTVRAALAVPATFHPTTEAAARVAQDYLPRESERPTAAGRLSIVTDPAGARVEVDGRPRGVSPVVIDGLAAAEHRITVVSDSGVAQRTIAVSKGVITEVVFSLPRPTKPVAGWVAVASPFPVEVLEHDEVVGTSSAATIMLAAGKHELLLRNENLGFEAARTITVVPGRVTSVEIDPPMGLLNVNARPWADVLIDGEMVGQTPLSSLSLAVGPHQVTFRHPQFGERTERIVVTARGVNRVAVDLNK